ncbi:aldo/keto reductase [Butyrivibrio sp. MB2005]|uniref:aldo/keto reductase n=1 Tax=Butyrivibrio sp. MB2005 TaxID=1280678 RepID=UPI0003F79A50|nr:aldo/keto reductase [Butyrivibrio sp. MB2005]
MKYRKNRQGGDISLLGFGCMRFTRKGAGIDMEKAEKEIMRAYELGVNYYDTAYIYPGSEVAIGEIFEKNHIREKIQVATKLPQYLIANKDAIEKYFKEQCSRLRTNYIDYYLMHMLSDINAWEKLKKLGIEEWIAEKKASGEIKHIGFSFHGNSEMFIEILNAYDWDFCQIQYNYLDEVSQAGRKGLEAAGEKGIPVIIMEPLRGGKLVDLLPEKAKKLIAEDEKHRSAAELAFRWLWDQPQVTCVLSGMNSVEMVEENCRVASEVEAGEFTEKDFQLIDQIKASINERLKVGCTGCGYCMPCPKGVDIPSTFRCYNAMYMDNKGTGRQEFFRIVGMRKEPGLPSQCIECGKCESHCPQHINIRQELKNADKALNPFYYKIALAAARKFLYRK